MGSNTLDRIGFMNYNRDFLLLKKPTRVTEGTEKVLKIVKPVLEREIFEELAFPSMSLISVAANAFLGASLEPLPSLRSVQGLKLLANPLEVVASTPINL